MDCGIEGRNLGFSLYHSIPYWPYASQQNTFDDFALCPQQVRGVFKPIRALALTMIANYCPRPEHTSTPTLRELTDGVSLLELSYEFSRPESAIPENCRY